MGDYLVRAVDPDGQFRIFAAVTTETAEEGRKRHDTWPIASAALGRALTAGLLLGANLKGDDLLTLRIQGDGPLGGILVSANGAGEVRGYVLEPHVDLPSGVNGKLPVGAAVGSQGLLHVTKDLGLKEPFTGSVELVSGEIGEDTAQYLLVSEQTPSAVSLGVLVDADARVKAAGGLLVQLFPDAEEKVLSHLEQRLAALPPISSLVDSGLSPEEIILQAVDGLPLRFLERNPVSFTCRCSKEKTRDILASLGAQELASLLEERGHAEVRCHFCGEIYLFYPADLTDVIGS